MIVLSIKEFDKQSTPGQNSLERIYQNKSLTAGPAFSLINLNAAKLYCQRFNRINKEAFCIIVEDNSCYRVWSENFIERKKHNKQKSVYSLPLKAEFIEVCKKKLAINIGPIANIICQKVLSKNPDLTRNEFVEILSQKISDRDLARKFKRELLD